MMNQVVNSRTQLNLTQMHLPELDLGGGKCWKAREAGVSVDTLIIHSCHVTPELKGDFSDVLRGRIPSEATACEMHREWKADPTNQRLEFGAIRALVEGCRGLAALEPYSVEGISEIFRFYGVSAHYAIDRTGKVFELVSPEHVAFHAGKSELPGDKRTGVNAFSLGIELFATESSGFTAEQMSALVALTEQLKAKFPITQIWGHGDIAPGRKTDPWGFDWKSYIGKLNFTPAGCPVS